MDATAERTESLARVIEAAMNDATVFCAQQIATIAEAAAEEAAPLTGPQALRHFALVLRTSFVAGPATRQ